ncbi:hypothetical protein A5819_003741 [Enterococcus sp. 7E2_DIV0204]|uniref:hypothetical protein n=1 Tax=unclassified Enterococcus TaxID=2608891 RepID=UPI000A35415A|nr:MULTISPECIES: hypothetical protein [unclassified Enterococcus]OTN83761.1 hypothetical protein A5819_003741 [Enterococcus sp. 7E2_DIV0204]OTP47132.1 hypothetical protein A5884_003669 [Enterococcus sp. 7D2_DIV0200]
MFPVRKRNELFYGNGSYISYFMSVYYGSIQLYTIFSLAISQADLKQFSCKYPKRLNTVEFGKESCGLGEQFIYTSDLYKNVRESDSFEEQISEKTEVIFLNHLDVENDYDEGLVTYLISTYEETSIIIFIEDPEKPSWLERLLYHRLSGSYLDFVYSNRLGREYPIDTLVRFQDFFLKNLIT